MKKLLFILLIVASCKKDDVKPSTQQSNQTYSIGVQGKDIYIYINNYKVSGNYVTVKKGDNLYIESNILTTTYLDSNGNITGNNGTNYLKVTENGKIIKDTTCSCDGLTFSKQY